MRKVRTLKKFFQVNIWFSGDFHRTSFRCWAVKTKGIGSWATEHWERSNGNWTSPETGRYWEEGNKACWKQDWNWNAVSYLFSSHKNHTFQVKPDVKQMSQWLNAYSFNTKTNMSHEGKKEIKTLRGFLCPYQGGVF